MHALFSNRAEAGRQLAARLERYAGRPDVIVLALPRGGLPVAAEVAWALQAPLDVVIVRKLGLPDNPELAMGAIASGGRRVLNGPVIKASGVPPEVIERVIVDEERELMRREQAYRHGRPAAEVRNRTVILVDDGIATGSTVRAAVAALRDAGAGRIIVATPVAARESYLELRPVVDELIVVHAPRGFASVGEFYTDFTQTNDAEVGGLLEAARSRTAADQAGGSSNHPFKSSLPGPMASQPPASRRH